MGEIWKIVRTPGKILATPLVPRMAGLCFWLVCVLLNRSILIVLHTYMLQAFFKDKNVPVPKNDRYLFFTLYLAITGLSYRCTFLFYNLIYICESTFDLSEVNIGILVSFQDSFKADVFFEKRSP